MKELSSCNLLIITIYFLKSTNFMLNFDLEITILKIMKRKIIIFWKNKLIIFQNKDFRGKNLSPFFQTVDFKMGFSFQNYVQIIKSIKYLSHLRLHTVWVLPSWGSARNCLGTGVHVNMKLWNQIPIALLLYQIEFKSDPEYLRNSSKCIFLPFMYLYNLCFLTFYDFATVFCPMTRWDRKQGQTDFSWEILF